jgi:signal transduction histidine kinase
MLVIGYGSLPPPDADWTDVIEASHAFVTVLELSRLRQQEELRRELRVLLDEFDDTLSSTLNLPTSLDVFCQRARRLFSADRTSVWIHDRLSHSLVLRASSDPSHMPRGDRIDTADPAAPAATGMRKSRSVITASAGDAPTGTLTVPLRGRRRALGTIVLEGVFFQTGSELDLVERADELGAGISGAIEHLQLLEDAGRARRELDTGEVGSAESSVEVDQHTLQERRQQSDKLAALGQLIAGIAHELNNPLQSVLGHLELMRTASTLSPAMRRDVRTVYREADRAAKIVRNLLVFAGSRRVVRRPVSLHAVLQKVLALRAQACRSLHIEVVRQYDEKLPRVLSDPLLLHQAFLNVVMNAEQAIAATGRPGRIEITTSSADGRIFATVRDSGDGIPADALSRVFEPFYTTKEVGKGSGLGLAITYGIVLEQGGDVAVVNHPSGGAAFTIELPISQTRSAAPVG